MPTCLSAFAWARHLPVFEENAVNPLEGLQATGKNYRTVHRARRSSDALFLETFCTNAIMRDCN
jgi:hypothetical protein